MSKPSRSQKSQSSKSGKKRHRLPRKLAASTALAILDHLLLRKTRISINSEEQEITVLAAIIHQLMQKEMAGDGHASRVLLKYEELARQKTAVQPQIAFVDNDYTQTLATPAPDSSDG